MKNKLFLMGIVAASWMGCDDSVKNVANEFEPVELKTTDLALSAAENHVKVQANTSVWFISAYQVVQDNDTTCVKNTLYELTTDDMVSVHEYKEVMKGDWFILVKREKELGVYIAENKTGKDRTLIVHLGIPVNQWDESLTIVQMKE